MRVSVNVIRTNHHSSNVCRHMAEGVEAAGDKIEMRSDSDADMKGFDAAIFWGFWENCQRIVEVCRREGKPWVYVDLAYWGRDKNYFKVSVNERHPDDYLMKWDAPSDRWDALGLEIKPWRKPSTTAPIILAGMSGKAAWSWKFGPTVQQAGNVYERWAVAQIKNHTERQIIYRPKPNWVAATPIDGASYDKTRPVELMLKGAHCVVTHHSNVGTDAIIAGVPVFTRRGAAIHMGMSDSHLSEIEAPVYPDGREQWAANLAYCQWTLNEMAAGACWKHLKARVLKEMV